MIICMFRNISQRKILCFFLQKRHSDLTTITRSYDNTYIRQRHPKLDKNMHDLKDSYLIRAHKQLFTKIAKTFR